MCIFERLLNRGSVLLSLLTPYMSKCGMRLQLYSSYLHTETSVTLNFEVFKCHLKAGTSSLCNVVADE